MTQSPFQNLINMQAQYIYLHQQDAFDDSEVVNEMRQQPLHIYLICKSPVIRIDPSLTKITTNIVSLTFFSNIGGNRKDYTIEMNNDQDIVRIHSEYPYHLVSGYDSRGHEVFMFKTPLLLKYLAAQRSLWLEEFNLEVLYVGQAFGKDGSRITPDRLMHHEKAQRIYFDTQQRFPDYEVWFMSITFRPLLMTMFRPSENPDPNLFDKELDKQQRLNSTPIAFDQRVTLTEAALIRYFNTQKYNKEYLNFPSREHSSYEEVYQLDFNSVGFELSTESLYVKVFSQTVEPAFAHYETYFLHSPEQRKDMMKWYEK